MTANLCTLPAEQQQAIEDDKALWFTAHQKFHNENRSTVLNWLETLPSDQKADMRRRLNAIQARIRSSSQNKRQAA